MVIQPVAPPAGRIITFYSYKGGTGRSMALANVAWILASAGKRVLAVDWDLEAPGLHRYFYPFLPDPDLTASDGIIDLVLEFRDEAFTKREKPPAPDWYLRYANILRVAASLKYKFPGKGTLDFVPAGRQGPSYSVNVNTFNWQAFYDDLGGGVFLDAVRDSMRKEYDCVLIDSRTGVSDTSGVCTVQMPDDLVVCFTLNNQSIEGASRVATVVATRRPPSSGFRIFPIAMRVEEAERDKLDLRREFMRERFGPFLGHLDSARRTGYWDQTEVLYKPWYAYEEVLATFGDRPGSPTTLLASLERLTGHLTGGEVREAVTVEERARQEILTGYRRRAIDATTSELEARAESLWKQLTPAQQAASRLLLLRLVGVPKPEMGGPLASTPYLSKHLDKENRDIVPHWVDAGILSEAGKADDTRVWLRDLELMSHWKRAMEWIDADRGFLLWRQKLHADVAEWEAGGGSGALLRGSRLTAAREWVAKRGGELSERELAYVQASTRGGKVTLYLRSAAAILILIWMGYNGLKQMRQDSQQESWLLSRLWVLRGDSLARQGSTAEALAAYETALSIVPGQADVLVRRGVQLDAADDTAAALADFAAAIQNDSVAPAALFARARLRARAGQNELAIEDLNRVLSTDTANAQAYYLRGTTQAAAGRGKEARDDLSQAVSRDSLNVEYLLARGAVNVDIGDRTQAVADYRRVTAIASNPTDRDVAAARLRQLGDGVPVNSRPSQYTVNVFFADSIPESRLDRLIGPLPSQWRIGTVAFWQRSQLSAVRYVAPEDAGAAGELAGYIMKSFAGQGLRLRLDVVQLSRLSVRGAGSSGVKILELWVPSLMAAAR